MTRRWLILIVDDDDDVREITSEILEDEGFATVKMASAIDALAYLKRGPAPDLILLDLMMPVMDGWQFRAQQLHDPTISAIPVVIMTANRRFDEAKLSANAVLLKPVTVEQLLATIRSALPSGSGFAME